jgi:hypothetical protein
MGVMTDCPVCGGKGVVYLPPDRLGYTHVNGRVWRMPDGRLYEFPPRVKVELPVQCGCSLPRAYAPTGRR